LPDDAGFEARVKASGEQAGGSMGQRLGAGLERALVVGGAVAGAVAIPALRMGDAYDEAADRIRIGTGLIGQDLDSVIESYKKVASTVPEDIGAVAQVTADLQTRTGLMGEALEKLTKSVLDYSRVTGSDPVANTQQLTRVFGDWNVATEDQIPTMDKLLRIQQATGVGAEELQPRCG
jgi:phage-related minor tail protein